MILEICALIILISRYNMNRVFLLSCLVFAMTACCKTQKEVGVIIDQKENLWQITINGRPLFINGVGGTNRLDVAAASGANAFRTWGGDVEEIRKNSQLASENHMYIMQGIYLPKDSTLYTDAQFRKEKIEEVTLLAQTFKNDTSIFAWGIGNEIELANAANTPAAWQFVDSLARLMKSIDKRHLVSTVISHNPGALDMIAKYAPNLDFVGVNSYGDILNVKNIVAESDYNGPYLITEWGPTGWWETRLTDWKAPIEQTSEQKRIVYEERYRNAVASDPRCMGSFVFLWGQKEERTPTWFSMFVEDNVPGLPLNGEKTPMVEAMERVWTKSEPKQTAPVVKRLTINSIDYNPYVGVNETVHAVVEVSDRENDRLTYVWEILKEATITATGGAYEPRPDRVGEVITTEENQLDVAVQDEGYYRLYVYVLDNTGYVATANIPFAVQ